jgi:hypothetical protein
MKHVEFIGYRDRNCERMAARHSLTFHLEGMFITDHDDDREAREATEAEQALWARLVGDFDPETLPTTADELRSCWKYRSGPFTVNATDAEVLFHMSQPEWVPETDALRLQMGYIGYFQNRPVYVSRAIPVGFFYEGPRIPEIHYLPHADMEPQQPDAELSQEVERKVRRELHPFMTDWV